jgi:hypothetical protein
MIYYTQAEVTIDHNYTSHSPVGEFVDIWQLFVNSGHFPPQSKFIEQNPY